MWNPTVSKFYSFIFPYAMYSFDLYSLVFLHLANTPWQPSASVSNSETSFFGAGGGG